MNSVLRRFRITTRIMALTVLAGVILAALMITALDRFHQQARASAQARDAARLAQLAMEAKFRTADAAGWQTGYAFDFNRGVPGAADDTVGQRKEFLASSAALSDLYAQLSRERLTPQQRTLLDTARASFAEFLSIDAKIVAGYRRGTTASVAASNELASGASLDAFGSAATATSDLAGLLVSAGTGASQATVTSASHGSTVVWVVGLTGIAAEILLAVLIVSSVARPLRAIRLGLADIAANEGDLRTRLPQDGSDELSLVGATINRFMAGTATVVGSVAGRTAELSTMTSRLGELAASLARSSSDVAERATSATGAAAEISTSARVAATGTEELSASIGDISRSTTEVSSVASEADAVTRVVNEKMARLGDSSSQINEVAQVITSIAEQTNLLALNATIEAARAGDAGKGFAVVATEVKELAQETARATEDISARIEAIQTDAAAAIAAIGQITDVIAKINGLQSVVAAAIETQSATTAQMGGNIGRAAEGSTRVADEVAGVCAIAEETTGKVEDLRAVAGDLSELVGRLSEMTERFQY